MREASRWAQPAGSDTGISSRLLRYAEGVIPAQRRKCWVKALASEKPHCSAISAPLNTVCSRRRIASSTRVLVKKSWGVTPKAV
ncbi:MAG: hypothetical protein EBS01_03065 [Verrucomicrobia bacterium]|nr:hypothetical protein [Verrucomicrobiota bacterium]